MRSADIAVDIASRRGGLSVSARLALVISARWSDAGGHFPYIGAPFTPTAPDAERRSAEDRAAAAVPAGAGPAATRAMLALHYLGVGLRTGLDSLGLGAALRAIGMHDTTAAGWAEPAFAAHPTSRAGVPAGVQPGGVGVAVADEGRFVWRFWRRWRRRRQAPHGGLGRGFVRLVVRRDHISEIISPR